jgi:Zn-dependent protease
MEHPILCYNDDIMNSTRYPIVRRMGQDWIFWLVVGAILVAFMLLQARSAVSIVYTLVALLVAITVHEFSHARAALWLGDATASANGRVSLNPLVHLDPLGTVMMFITTLTGLGIGWGKPVPVMTHRLRFGPRVGHALVSLAGPLSNVATAIVVGLVLRVGPGIVGPAGVLAMPWLADLLASVVLINLVIAIFNLLPIPPLDGYSVLIGLLALTRSRWGFQAANRLESWNRFGMMLLFGLILFSQFLRLNVLWSLVGQPAYSLFFLILGV